MEVLLLSAPKIAGLLPSGHIGIVEIWHKGVFRGTAAVQDRWGKEIWVPLR